MQNLHTLECLQVIDGKFIYILCRYVPSIYSKKEKLPTFLNDFIKFSIKFHQIFFKILLNPKFP